MTAIGDARRTWNVRYFAANGDVLDFGDQSRFVAQLRHGFGLPDFQEFTTTGIRQQGDTLTGIRAMPRQVEVPVYLLPRAEPMNSLRRRVADAMNPLLGDGILEYYDNQLGETWQLTCRPKQCKLDSQPRTAFAHLETLLWTAHDPWWYGPLQRGQFNPNGAAVEIVVGGTLDVGWTLTLPGPINNPSFQNLTTGTGIGFNLYVDPDHVLQVRSIYNRKSAILIFVGDGSSTSVYPNRQIGSTYWTLGAGSNLITLAGTPPVAPPYQLATLEYAAAVQGV